MTTQRRASKSKTKQSKNDTAIIDPVIEVNESEDGITSGQSSNTSSKSLRHTFPFSVFNILRGIFEYLDPQAIENFKIPSNPKILFHKTEEISEKTKHFIKNNKVIKDQLNKLDSKFEDIFFNEPTTYEKLFYSLTVLNIFLLGFIMGQYPQYFHIYYTCLFLLLIPLRFYTYYKTQQHYFMADLCYYVNFMVLSFIWFFPNSKELYISSFALTFGTLCWAVITWRNSLVIHSMDKVTSCFIHIMPPLTVFVIHFLLEDTEYQKERFPIVAILRSNYEIGTGGKHGRWSIKFSVFYTSLYYLGWQILYHYFITFRKSEKLKSKQRMTSFRYLTEHTFKNTYILKDLIVLQEPWPMVSYVLLQYIYQLLTMSLCTIWFRSKIAAATFLTCIVFSAAYRGATYYVDRYMDQTLKKEVKRLQLEIRSLQGESSLSDSLLT